MSSEEWLNVQRDRRLAKIEARLDALEAGNPPPKGEDAPQIDWMKVLEIPESMHGQIREAIETKSGSRPAFCAFVKTREEELGNRDPLRKPEFAEAVAAALKELS